MKKLFYALVLTTLLLPFTLRSQINYNNNTVDSISFASAIGSGNIATGEYAFAGGESSLADNTDAFAFGFQATASGLYSIALGNQATASGINSFALGANIISSGNTSFAFGSASESLGTGSFALGFLVKTQLARNFVIGRGIDSGHKLENTLEETMMIGFNSTKPTLFISKSLNSGSSYDKTGKIAIGNMIDPLAKLHIYSDDDESATLFLQPSNWTNDLNAEIFLGDMNHGISAEVDAGMVYNTEEYHIFKGGDVFVEDIDKGIIMKSPDGNCWRGVLDNSGQLHFTQLETCPGITVAVAEMNDNGTNANLKVYPNPANDYVTVELLEATQNQHTVSLLDEKGAVLTTTRMSGMQTQLYIGNLPAGVYFVQVSGEKTKSVQKILKR